MDMSKMHHRLFVVGVLFLFVPTILCMSDEMKELAEMLHNTCVGETGASEDAIEAARKGNFAEDQNLKCYMKCLYDQMAIMGDDGMLDIDAMVAMLPEEIKDKLEGTIRKCGTKVGADHCDNAFLTNKCYQAESPQDYFLI